MIPDNKEPGIDLMMVAAQIGGIEMPGMKPTHPGIRKVVVAIGLLQVSTPTPHGIRKGIRKVVMVIRPLQVGGIQGTMNISLIDAGSNSFHWQAGSDLPADCG